MKANIIFIGLIIMALIHPVSVSVAKQTAVPNSLTVPKGTIIKVQAVETINSRKLKKYDKVYFKVAESLVVEGFMVISANTEVEAVAKTVNKAGPWDKDGEIEVAFSEIKTNAGYSFPVAGELLLRGDKPNVLVRYSLSGVLVKGKEAVIKAGAAVNLQVKEDVVIHRDMAE